tara:strand:- start:1205 stop:1411 length:207 start_codon:yes stop_codon:yes gene_type:complete
MEIEVILASIVPSIGAIIGVWVKMNTEIEKLKGRIYSLESDRNELKILVKECIEGIQELKLLLAKKGI